MSLPSFPEKGQLPSREEVINQIISSIAMEELGLSHIINAEGEKLQYALGTIDGVPGPDIPATIDDLLKLNESVHETLNSTMMNQFFLKEKLLKALSASVMQGPAGPEGPEGPDGPEGPEGPQGTGTTLKGKGDSKAQLDQDYPNGPPEDAYLVDGEIYIWNKDDGWHSAGSIRGPVGTLIKGTYPTLDELKKSHPDGPPEDAYLVDGELYIWDKDKGWHSAGNLRGPEGESYTIIPFASAEAPLTFARNGEPTKVSLLGFGYGDRRGEGGLSAADYSIFIEPNNQSFTLNKANGNQNKQVVFSLPFNMILKSIYITVGTYDLWTFPSKCFPYIQLYMADPGTNNFIVIPRAIAMPTEGIGPGSIVADTMLHAHIDGLNVPLKAGTRLAIGAMMKTEGSTVTQESYWLYFTGGIGLVYDPDPIL